MERHGRDPMLYREQNELSEIERIKMLISEFNSQKEYKSLGLICKTDTQATFLLGELSDLKLPINLLTNTSSRFEDGIMITSAQIAKGLEFDSVIVPFVNVVNYRTKIDRSMLYIAVTRAMHELNITLTGIPSALLNEKKRL
jgi:ATP-dependent DNA helicase UvrD/PcrA